MMWINNFYNTIHGLVLDLVLGDEHGEHGPPPLFSPLSPTYLPPYVFSLSPPPNLSSLISLSFLPYPPVLFLPGDSTLHGALDPATWLCCVNFLYVTFNNNFSIPKLPLFHHYYYYYCYYYYYYYYYYYSGTRWSIGRHWKQGIITFYKIRNNYTM